MTRANFATIFIALILIISLPRSVAAFDLLDVYRLAQTHDAAFAAARAQRDAGQEKRAQGRAGLLPNISATANTTWNEAALQQRGSSDISRATYNSRGWQVNLVQPLFRWENWQAYQEGDLQAQRSDVQYTQAEMDLLLRCAQAYFDHLYASDNLAALNTQQAAIAAQLAQARKHFEVGSATITDTHEAQARFDLVTAQTLAAQNDLAAKREALQTLVGDTLPPGLLQPLREDIALPAPQPRDQEAWASQAAQAAPAVQLARLDRALAETQAEKERGGHLPSVDLVASQGKSRQNATLLFNQVYPGTLGDNKSVGLNLTIPLLAGGLTTARRQEAVLLAEKARFLEEDARRNARLQARQAYLAAQSNLAQAQALTAALVSSRLALESNQLGYEVGVRISTDVLNAQSQWVDTRLKLLRARLDALLQLLKLKATAGILAAPDLVAINALLALPQQAPPREQHRHPESRERDKDQHQQMP